MSNDRYRATKAFEKDLRRGRLAERLAPLWLRGIDFNNLKQPHLMHGTNGALVQRPLLNCQKWQLVPGYNKNKDFIVTNTKTNEQKRHEIKVDYKCFVDNPWREYGALRSLNIFVEVDLNNVANLEEVKETACFKGIEPRNIAWFNSNDGGHADFYEYYLPFLDVGWSDERGKLVVQANMLKDGRFNLDKEAIKAFKNDRNKTRNSGIVTQVPFEAFLVMTWDKLKELLERIAHIEFNTHYKPGEKGKLRIALPLNEVVKELKGSDTNYDGKMTMVPVCRFAPKKANRYKKLYMSKQLMDVIKRIEYGIVSAEEATKFLEPYFEKRGLPVPPLEGNGIMRIIGQNNEIIESYRNPMDNEVFEYFNTAIAADYLPIYREQR